jgi:diguanylate cyclase (GGDEF)-like protein
MSLQLTDASRADGPIVRPASSDVRPAAEGAADRRVRLRSRRLVVLAVGLSMATGTLAFATLLGGIGGDGSIWLVAIAAIVPLLLVPATAWLAWMAGQRAGVAAATEAAATAAAGRAEARPRRREAGIPSSGPAASDLVTGLPGHRAFHEELEALLRDPAAAGHALSIAIIDVDDFRRVNEGAGHGVGDDLLVELTEALVHGHHADERIYRIGGDEFAVIVPGQDAEHAAFAIRRVLAAVLEERSDGIYRSAFSFSAGIAGSADRSTRREVLVGHARNALDQAKRDGRCVVRVWGGGEGDESIERSVRAAGVLRVLASGGLRPVYQPMVELSTGRVIAFEGLIRPPEQSLFHDTGSLFEAAEEAGRTIELDLACMAAVLVKADTIGEEQSISLNLSPRTLEAPEFGVAAFVRRLALAGWTPDRVIVELTERDGVEDIERIRRVLADLRAHGIRVAADDVGAGNAGLRLLSQIHFDIVKLDLSLVQGGLRRDTSLAVVRSIADLAARWGASVVAEGVETPEQLRLIRRLGLTAAQGFLVGAPRPAPDARVVDLDGLESLAEDLDGDEGGWAHVPAPA